MRLILYHSDHDPYVIMNVIKMSDDVLRTLTVKIKERKLIEQKIFRYGIDYQRLTVEVD